MTTQQLPPATTSAAPATAPAAGPAVTPATAPAAGQGPGNGRQNGGSRRRGWLTALAVAGVVIVGAVGVVLLAPSSAPSNSYLDPGSTASDGARAITDLLAGRGQSVTTVYGPKEAAAAASRPDTTLVITSPEILTGGDMKALASVPADIVLVAPDQQALDALQSGIIFAEPPAPAEVLQPGCALPAATQAGSALTGGVIFNTGYSRNPATDCYFAQGSPSLVTYSSGSQTVVLLGDGTLFTNGRLASQGNAALALNLLAARHNVVWLAPQYAVASLAGPGSSGPQVITTAAWMVVWQLIFAVLLAAGWRIRRLGALIPERLPVVVRASETVEGHARLYQARRARDRAAAQLRHAMLGRIMIPLGLPRGSAPPAITQAIAGRSRLPEPMIAHVLFGPAPGSDADLVTLARQLDELEREVRAQ